MRSTWQREHPPVTRYGAAASPRGRRHVAEAGAVPGSQAAGQAAGDTPLSARGLTCIKGDRLLFTEVDVDLREGEALQIHGSNGSGKTTLLRILCGLTLQTEGEIYWHGEDIASERGRYFAEMAYVGHANGIKLELTPLENLRFARALEKHPSDTDLDDALARLDLQGFEDVPARTLSAGQRRRVALARLLTCEARLWILDEPFTSLDRASCAAIEHLLHEHVTAQGMVIFTSHQPVKLAEDVCREIHLG